MSTAQWTSSARSRISPSAVRIADSSLSTFFDHRVVPVSSTAAAQWWPLPASIPAHTWARRSLIRPSSVRTVCRRPEEHPAVISVNSDRTKLAHLNQQPGRPGEPGGHSFEATEGKNTSATPGPPGPPNNLRSDT